MTRNAHDSVRQIREILNQTRTWSLYALGDLAPEELVHCEWRFSLNAGPAATLFYRAFDPPIFFATGSAEAVEPLLDQAPLPSRLYLHIRPEILRLVNDRYHRVTTKEMVRMILQEPSLVDFAGVKRLDSSDLNDLVELYDSRQRHEKDGTFFLPEFLARGIYFGVRVNDRLVAAAGTHLVNPADSVAALGNVFCLPEYRGKGLGAAVSSAVVDALRERDIRTIGLNVGPDNPAAKLYRRLGFEEACSYVEGTAVNQI